ncbi:hypothetical protein [Paenibacillus sp. FSL R10-2736]|uniref:hypothetical protein n=1 Tax=Paenibacillus sp. FSL R10-2736 TaxID=2954692 RepID=UPI0030F928F7
MPHKYVVSLQATDALGLASEVKSKTIMVNELGILATVTHTPEWEDTGTCSTKAQTVRATAKY